MPATQLPVKSLTGMNACICTAFLTVHGAIVSAIATTSTSAAAGRRGDRPATATPSGIASTSAVGRVSVARPTSTPVPAAHATGRPAVTDRSAASTLPSTSVTNIVSDMSEPPTRISGRSTAMTAIATSATRRPQMRIAMRPTSPTASVPSSALNTRPRVHRPTGSGSLATWTPASSTGYPGGRNAVGTFAPAGMDPQLSRSAPAGRSGYWPATTIEQARRS